MQKRCCSTELAPSEVPRHATFFGRFAIEFDVQAVTELGAIPVFYIPRMPSWGDYGVGPALITQLAHVQDLIDRLRTLRTFAESAAAVSPEAPLFGRMDADGLCIEARGTTHWVKIPNSFFDRARVHNPGYKMPETPTEGAPIGAEVGGLASILRLVGLGIHKLEVLRGTMGGLASLFYSTERLTSDPLLRHYFQREWRVIGNLRNRGSVGSPPPTPEQRTELLKLDPEFFGKELELPSGRMTRVDACQVLATSLDGRTPVLTTARRIICPREAVAAATTALAPLTVPVVALETLSD